MAVKRAAGFGGGCWVLYALLFLYVMEREPAASNGSNIHCGTAAVTDDEGPVGLVGLVGLVDPADDEDMLIVTDDPPTDQVLHEGLLEVSKASVEPVLEVVATQEQQQDPLYRDDLFIPADLPASKTTDGALRSSHFK